MGITYGDYLIDIGDDDITPEQEEELNREDLLAKLWNENAELRLAHLDKSAADNKVLVAENARLREALTKARTVIATHVELEKMAWGISAMEPKLRAIDATLTEAKKP